MEIIGFPRAKVVRYAWAVLLTYALMLVILTLRGQFLFGPQGAADVDFINVWAAGRLALDGNAAAAYDWLAHRRMEVVGLGHDFDGYYGWHYPPMLLFAAAPLALFPYLPAWLLWSAATAALLAWVLRRVFGEPAVALLAMTAPTTVMCTVVGQNGFLTAALITGGLGFMQRRPLLAGLFLGLLTYKPQFGLLFPIALLAGRQWRTLLSAAATALTVALASALVFGLESWRAFLHSTGLTMEVLRQGAPGWHKLQSVYALLHPLGEDWAWAGQAAAATAAAALVAWMFARPQPHALRAAVLAAAVPLATPYGYVYDLAVQAAAAAFLARDGLDRGFSARQGALLVAALALPWSFQWLGSGTGLLSSLLMVGIAVVRARQGCYLPEQTAGELARRLC